MAELIPELYCDGGVCEDAVPQRLSPAVQVSSGEVEASEDFGSHPGAHLLQRTSF